MVFPDLRSRLFYIVVILTKRSLKWTLLEVRISKTDEHIDIRVTEITFARNLEQFEASWVEGKGRIGDLLGCLHRT